MLQTEHTYIYVGCVLLRSSACTDRSAAVCGRASSAAAASRSLTPAAGFSITIIARSEAGDKTGDRPGDGRHWHPPPPDGPVQRGCADGSRRTRPGSRRQQHTISCSPLSSAAFAGTRTRHCCRGAPGDLADTRSHRLARARARAAGLRGS